MHVLENQKSEIAATYIHYKTHFQFSLVLSSFPFLHSIASFFRRTNVQLQQTDIHSLEGDSFFCGDVKVLVIRLLLFFSYQVFVKAASYRVYRNFSHTVFADNMCGFVFVCDAYIVVFVFLFFI